MARLGSKVKENERGTIEFKEHFRIVNNAIEKSIRLEEEIEEKNKLIEQLRAKPIAVNGREKLKNELLDQILETNKHVTGNFVITLLDELKEDVIKKTMNLLLTIKTDEE